ncbi:MAG: nucleotidyltransferase, partial [Oscillospiraceae bacterium]|nr:nucleotidyltransferase [Oscillospiraceae bacterium]
TELLRLCKIRSEIPVNTSLAELRGSSAAAERFAELETNTAHLYGLAQKQITSAETEFRRKIQLIK